MDKDSIRSHLQITNRPPRHNLRDLFQLFQQQKEGLVIYFLNAEVARWEILQNQGMSADDQKMKEIGHFFGQFDPQGYTCQVGAVEYFLVLTAPGKSKILNREFPLPAKVTSCLISPTTPRDEETFLEILSGLTLDPDEKSRTPHASIDLNKIR
jgi:hypothetical protein